MHRHVKIRIGATLTLALLTMATLTGCGRPQATTPHTEVEAVPTFTVTPVWTPTAAKPPTQTPTSTPTLAPSPTFTPTALPTATSTPTPVPSPTLLPMSALSLTPVVSGVEHAPEEGDQEEGVPSVDLMVQRAYLDELHNLEANWEGQIRLEVRGHAVHAVLQSARSPVQYFARQQPEVLFTVPEGFRPAVPLTWAVIGQQVDADGKLDPSQRDPRVFRLHVDTAGQVRYVDDSGVDGVAYLRFRTALAWPLADTDPQVCQRQEGVRRQILSVLEELGEIFNSCADITWQQLSVIKALPSPIRGQIYPRDFVGLSHLASLHLLLPETQPTLSHDLLVHSPQLTQFKLRFKLDDHEPTALPATLLAFTPLLENLTLELKYWPRNDTGQYQVPAGLLHFVPFLRRLEIYSDANFSLDFLEPVPKLTYLDVRGSGSTFYARHWLKSTPELSHLRLTEGFIPHENLLAPVPNLKLLDFRVGTFGKLPSFPEGFLRHTPQLDSLTLVLRDAKTIPADLLSYTGELTELSLDFGEILKTFPDDLQISLPNLNRLSLTVRGLFGTTIGEDFLLSAPRLTHLTLKYSARSYRRDHILTLPGNFLARAPQLQSLTIDVGKLDPFPTDLLAYTPHLKAFSLNDSESEDVPWEILQSTPELEDLFLNLPAVTDLPPELLTAAPKLRKLDFSFDPETELSSGFLANMPLLEELKFQAETVPPGFLDSATQLKSITLKTDNGIPHGFLSTATNLESLDLVDNKSTSVPDDFLIHDFPRLKHVRLQMVALQELPDGFLARAPALEEVWFDRISVGWGKEWLMTALPSRFLTDAPRLDTVVMYLDAVSDLPDGFLQNSPRLRRITLSAPGMAHLPSGFLSNTPYLIDAYLELGSIPTLGEGTLASTPKLARLTFTARSILQLPDRFLASAPHLQYIWISTDVLSVWPDEFLGDSTRLEEVSIYAPGTSAQLGPHHPLWPTLERTSQRVVVSSLNPTFTVETHGECPGNFPLTKGSPLRVYMRERDSTGNTFLRAVPEHRQYCSVWIDARDTEPTVS